MRSCERTLSMVRDMAFRFGKPDEAVAVTMRNEMESRRREENRTGRGRRQRGARARPFMPLGAGPWG